MERDDKPMDADKIEGLRLQLPSESEIADLSAAQVKEKHGKSTIQRISRLRKFAGTLHRIPRRSFHNCSIAA